MANMGGDMVALAGHFFVGMLIVLIMESGLSAICKGRKRRKNSNMIKPNDIEVDAKWHEKSLIKVTDLHKVYDKNDALISTNFHVFEHECFSLLGENGAGKSTSFKILTREENPTSGYVKLLGRDVETNQARISKDMGYCPQDDVLFDLLTVEEHLHFYARLRCLQDRAEHIEALIKTL